MTITNDELARLESRAKAGLLGTRQDDADAIAAVAEVRRLDRMVVAVAKQRDQFADERDALRAEAAELRASLDDALLKDRGKTQEINARTGESRELRASLADAVARMERMEPVVEAARALRHYDTSVECRRDSAIQFCRLEREHRQAVDAYEASLPRLTLERETVTAMATLDPKGRGVTTE